VVNAGTVYPTKTVFRDTDLALPNSFRLPAAQMKFLTSHKAAIWWNDSVSSRVGNLSDDTLTKGGGITPFNGMSVVPIPMFPENLGVGSNETNILYLDPKIVIVGFQRNIRIEQQRDPASGSTTFHVSIRMDVKVEHEAMCVKTTGVKVI
jgi:hypothetical protein